MEIVSNSPNLGVRFGDSNIRFLEPLCWRLELEAQRKERDKDQ
jgi:hypothetical protein